MTETAPLWKVEYDARRNAHDDWQTKAVELYAADRCEARGLSAQMLHDDGWQQTVIHNCYQPRRLDG
jgi:hypothetical protein